jgi:cobalt-zinc-cadmium efflux system membrane fusion protein
MSICPMNYLSLVSLSSLIRKKSSLPLVILFSVASIACDRTSLEVGEEAPHLAASNTSMHEEGFSSGACGDTHNDGHDDSHEVSHSNIVHLDTASLRIANIQLDTVTTLSTTGLPVTGTITYDANRVTHMGSRTEGRLIALRADVGMRVRAGEVLAILESPTVGQIRAEEHEAEALVRIARENFARENRLAEQGISSRKELLAAEADLRRAEAALRSAQERLRVLGAGQGHGSEFTMVAPFAGVVVAREVSLGEMVTPADQLFTIADLSRVWIELDIFERDLSRIKVGQQATVTTPAYPTRVFPGRISHLGAVVDTQKRTVRARVDIPNTDGYLKPGMFAKAIIQIDGGGEPIIVVPRNSVQELERQPVLFVPGKQVGEFCAVPIELGQAVDGDWVVIRAGIRPGERFVTNGSFALRSELAKGEIDGHGH